MEQGWPGLAQYIPSNPADWNPRPRTVQDALDTLAKGGSAVAAANMFVWQPGGATGGNVYATLATLETALLDVEGPKIVGVDTSLGAAVIDATGMPVAGWNFDDVTFVPALQTVEVAIAIAVGAKIAPATQNLGFVQCVVTNNATATVWLCNKASAHFLMLKTSGLESTAAGAFADVSTDLAISMEQSCILGDGTHAVVKVESTGLLAMIAMTATLIRDNAIAQGTAPGGAVQTTLDGASFLSPTQGAGPVYAQIITDPQPTFVFKPGATGSQNANVFTTWATLMAEVQQVTGDASILVDDSLGAAHATTGTWNMDGVTLLGATPFTGNKLIVDAGSVWTGSSLRLKQGVRVENHANIVMTVAGGASFQLFLEESAQLTSAVATAFLSQTNSNVSIQASGAAQLGEGTNPIVTVAVGQTCFVALDNASALAHAFAGAGSVDFFRDAAAASGAQDTGVTTVFLVDVASNVGYTPATAGNWQPAPTQAAAALDQLAAPNFVQAAANTGTGTTTSTAVTGNIAKLRSGKVQVRGVATGLISANGTITVSLLRDATPILTLPAITVLSTTGHSIPINFIDTLPNTANHTYTVQQVADGAHTITVGAGGNLISAVEL